MMQGNRTAIRLIYLLSTLLEFSKITNTVSPGRGDKKKYSLIVTIFYHLLFFVDFKFATVPGLLLPEQMFSILFTLSWRCVVGSETGRQTVCTVVTGNQIIWTPSGSDLLHRVVVAVVVIITALALALAGDDGSNQKCFFFPPMRRCCVHLVFHPPLDAFWMLAWRGGRYTLEGILLATFPLTYVSVRNIMTT